jgi:zinc/manganese transport system permease protein
VSILADGVKTDVPFSWNPLDDLQRLFQFEFMHNAYAAGTAAAIAAGVVGYFVVLRSLSFAAHSLTQIGFAGATGALAAGVNPLYGLLLINGASAGVIGVLGRRLRDRDVVVGIVLTASLGLGLLFLRLYRATEAIPVLVGDVFGISPTQVLITEVACAAILVAVALTWRPMLFSSLDEEIAEARGVHVGLMSLLLLLILAVTTSVTTPIVGVLLSFALLVGPAATAAVLSSRPPRAVALSVALSVAYIWIGLAVSYWVDFPPSVFVTGMAFAGYIAARLVRGGRARTPRLLGGHPIPALIV